ncbi:Metallo-beta-lactamase superfamily protein [Deinococcus reticulitermitis]|uniref:Metallo-beta-lactamase superfamily protein n=1 Tax=Deinococcus reticulitermitis TaxID=856736 RepID=A0A1H6VLZ0_9DEIO|nr:MBL fold metallo-hydrolase [Deinococcus reticulitermitis]SEJ05633.1 Metallo-beta-lactamase superfamily protein [Deinococcus reticulitermitis]
MTPTVTEHPTPLPQVRVFRSDPEVDCFAVICERLVLVVDTFGTPEEAGQMMERPRPELGGRALAVVNTHWHYDHAWGNQLFAADGPTRRRFTRMRQVGPIGSGWLSSS